MRLFRYLLPYLPFIVLVLAVLVAVAHIRWYW
jgi:hypothetical protein